jgi:AbrB family looped-hinge helix DNA binding protein
MTTLVKIQRNGQMTLPSRVRTVLGVSEGDVVELSLKQGKAIPTPWLVIDRSRFPSADDESDRSTPSSTGLRGSVLRPVQKWH